MNMLKTEDSKVEGSEQGKDELKEIILGELQKAKAFDDDVLGLIPEAFGTYEVESAEKYLQSMTAADLIRGLVENVRSSRQEFSDHVEKERHYANPFDRTKLDLTRLAQVGDLARAVEKSGDQVALAVSNAYAVDIPSLIPKAIRLGIARIVRNATNLEEITREGSSRPF